MAYETKVLLIALSKIVKKAESIEEIYNSLTDMANAEGVILKPFNEKETTQNKESNPV